MFRQFILHNTEKEVIKLATTGDLYVLNTQKWLNTTYGNDDRFNTITEDGKTGWPTIYALTRALQIELGITSTADSFGPSTQSLSLIHI